MILKLHLPDTITLKIVESACQFSACCLQAMKILILAFVLALQPSYWFVTAKVSESDVKTTQYAGPRKCELPSRKNFVIQYVISPFVHRCNKILRHNQNIRYRCSFQNYLFDYVCLFLSNLLGKRCDAAVKINTCAHTSCTLDRKMQHSLHGQNR